jgi:protein-S-isoprenylcysteine O-methyltransferase Ste14
MDNVDILLYLVHAVFWGTFVLNRQWQKTRHNEPLSDTSESPLVENAQTAKYSRSLLVFHMFAFGVMYFAIGQSVFSNSVPNWFVGQRLIGTLIIAIGAALMSWALIFFNSWRFRAKLEKGHKLATGGPFKFLRHPLYMGLNLLALGTAIWMPTALAWVALALIVVGSDLRARAEEVLLTQVFGPVYTSYCARIKRFLPGIY